MNILKELPENVYLEYVNAFLTVSFMASYYSVSPEKLAEKIKEGQRIHANKYDF